MSLPFIRRRRRVASCVTADRVTADVVVSVACRVCQHRAPSVRERLHELKYALAPPVFSIVPAELMTVPPRVDPVNPLNALPPGPRPSPLPPTASPEKLVPASPAASARNHVSLDKNEGRLLHSLPAVFVMSFSAPASFMTLPPSTAPEFPETALPPPV